MTGILKVDSIQNPAGSVTVPIGSLDIVLDKWRLASEFTTSGVTLTGWERPDDATLTTIGTGMSESSGIFTFPQTGVWEVDFLAQLRLASGDVGAGAFMDISTDSGSNYDHVATGYEGSQGGDAWGSLTLTAIVNVNNASTFRLKILTDSVLSGSKFMGATDMNWTTLTVKRLANAQ